MKKVLSVTLALVLGLALISGCRAKKDVPASSFDAAPVAQSEKSAITPLPNEIDLEHLSDCTLSVSLKKGDVFVDENGKTQMTVTVYTYDLYDMADISSLEVGDTILRLGKNVKVTDMERLDTGLIHVNGGEENGGFDLFTEDSTVYYEIGMNDIKAYYELGKITLPLGKEFVYLDLSEFVTETEEYNADVLLDDSELFRYDFIPNNTNIDIQNGEIIEMRKTYMP